MKRIIRDAARELARYVECRHKSESLIGKFGPNKTYACDKCGRTRTRR